MRDDLEVTPLHRSLVRPVLVFGVDRALVGPLLALAAMLMFGFDLGLLGPVLGVLVLVVGLPALRLVNARDPWAFRVLRRHLVVSGFYPAQPHHDVPRSAPPTL